MAKVLVADARALADGRTASEVLDNPRLRDDVHALFGPWRWPLLSPSRGESPCGWSLSTGRTWRERVNVRNAQEGWRMKKLRDVMRPGFLFVVQREEPVREAVRVMTDNNVGIVLVLEGERLVGVFSERDVVRRVVGRGLDPDRTPVGDVMTAEIIVGDPDDDHQSAIRKMDQANIRHLLVVRGREMLSMISIRDLIRVEMQDKGDEIRYLREYLYQVPSEPAGPGLA
jgi:CBS domain-containing protein